MQPYKKLFTYWFSVIIYDRKVCIKLTGIAKSSLEELIGDLEDFLRQRDLGWGYIPS